jgi:hypothetical protein
MRTADISESTVLKIPESIAVWKERDTVICLLDPIIGGYGVRRLSPSIPVLRNAANMAFLYGANSLSTYARLHPRDDGPGKAAGAGYAPEEYRAINEYIGRISVMLRGARSSTNVALYYPISTFQADYKPSNQFWIKTTPPYNEKQAQVQRVEKALLDAERDFHWVHPQALEQAKIENGTLRIGSGRYRYLVMPQIEIIPSAVLKKIKEFEATGGTVLWVGRKPEMGEYPNEDAEVAGAMRDASVVPVDELALRVAKPYDDRFLLEFTANPGSLSVSRFKRQDKCIYYLVNRTADEITVNLKSKKPVTVRQYDPSTGSIQPLEMPVDISISAYGSMLFVQDAE